MNEAARRRAEAHLDGCDDCRRHVQNVLATSHRTLSSPVTRDPTLARPGDVVGRYTLRRRIGAGGMGVVWLAHDDVLGRDIAVKFIRSGNAEAVRCEAEALAAVEHADIVRVFDVAAVGEGLCIAMEYVDALTFDRWSAGRIHRWRELSALGVRVASALAAAHDAGVVHADIKPGNILVCRDGTPKIVDFGLADAQRVLKGPSSRSDTAPLDQTPRERGGTPAYMAPEQRSGGAIDARADIYALGVTLRGALLAAPRRVHRVLERASAPDRDRRYGSMKAFADALERACRPRTRWWLVAAALVMGVTAATWTPPSEDRCERGARRVAEVLDRTNRGGRPRDVLSMPVVARYSDSWRSGHARACALEPSPSRERALECLEGRLHALSLVLDALESEVPDRETRVVSAVGSLPFPGACVDGPLPSGDSVSALGTDLAAARAAFALAHDTDAAALARQVAREAAVFGDSVLEARARLLLAMVEQRGGDPKAAKRMLDEVLAQAVLVDDARLQVRAWEEWLWLVGITMRRRDDALGQVGHALAALERAGSPAEEESELRATLAALYMNEGQFDAAGREIARLESIVRTHEVAPTREIQLHTTRASLAGRRGDFDSAAREYETALALRNELQGVRHPARAGTLRNLAIIQARKGDLGGAAIRLREAANVLRSSERAASTLLVTIERDLAQILLHLGDLAPALEFARSSVEHGIATHGELHVETAKAKRTLGDVLLSQGHSELAAETFREAIAGYEASEGYTSVPAAETLAAVAVIDALQGRDADALRRYDRAYAALEQDGPLHARAFVLANRGALALEQGRLRDARADLERSVEFDTREAGEDAVALAFALTTLAAVDAAEGLMAAAQQHAERAWRLVEAAGVRGTSRAHAAFGVAKVLGTDPASRARALALVDEAESIYATESGFLSSTGLSAIRAWRAAHDSG